MITVWDDADDVPVPFTLVTPQGSLALNAQSGDRYILRRDGCSVDRPLRVTVDQIPQGDGTILHRRFTQGYTVTLKIDFWVGTSLSDSEPACGQDLVRMTDALMLHVNAMLNAEDARLLWTPPGYAGRMFTNLRWRSFPTQDPEEPGESVTVSFDTPFPYAISQLQTTPTLGAPVTNAGTADFYPVLHIDGPSSAFVVTNDTLGQGIVYDSSRPGGVALGGSDYAEIDTFRNTIVLNGDVQDLDAGVNPLLSVFFWFEPGASNTSIVGATGYVLMNDAWA